MINKRSRNKSQAGQAVLIVLLSLSVVLIIVLYILSRSVTDISLSTKEENSMRAFSAAEAGIERALVIGSSISETTIGDATFTAGVTNFGTSQNALVYPISLKSGEITNFWFSRPAETAFTGSSAKICWGTAGTSASTSETPAVEVSVYYLTGGTYRVARTVLDPNTGRTATNSFSTASASSCTVSGETFAFQSTVDFATLGIASYATPDVLQYMTVKLLYNTATPHKVGIDVSASGSVLPSQGIKVNSSGTFGDSNRSIEVYQLHPVAPSVFMNAVYSANGITK